MLTLALMTLLLTTTEPSQSTVGDQPRRLTLELAKRIIRQQGARKAAESGLDDYWGELLAAVASAQTGWLDIAADLRAYSDAEASETLDGAMGEALRRSPLRVLRRLDGRPFAVSHVCGNNLGETGLESPTDPRTALKAQEAAVAGVQDAKLSQRRDECLALIRKRMQERVSATAASNKGMKQTKPSILELRSLSLVFGVL